MKILYISYDGILEPLGQSQVLAYLQPLALIHTIHLISYEKKLDWNNTTEKNKIANNLSNFGIVWHPLRYHKKISILATSWDIFIGIIVAFWLVLRNRIEIVHARSYVPSVICLVLKISLNVKYLFDMRGFWADERVDGGLWKATGNKYKIAKWFEKKFFLSANHVVVLTKATILELNNFPYLRHRLPPITVIPTCADLSNFAPLRDNHKASNNFVLGYIGSVGTWYLFDEVIACFSELLHIIPNAHFLIVNRNEHEVIIHKLSKAKIPLTSVELISSKYYDMPKHIRRMNAGVFFIKPVFSKKASSPTKLGEFLGCGVPCISNKGVGDVTEILETEQVGIVLSSFSLEHISMGLKQLLLLTENSSTSARCIIAANKYFSVDEGVDKYHRIYEQLI